VIQETITLSEIRSLWVLMLIVLETKKTGVTESQVMHVILAISWLRVWDCAKVNAQCTIFGQVRFWRIAQCIISRPEAWDCAKHRPSIECTDSRRWLAKGVGLCKYRPWANVRILSLIIHHIGCGIV
jgi:hypothetical protein